MKKYVQSINDLCQRYGIKCGDVLMVIREIDPGTNHHVYEFEGEYYHDEGSKMFWARNFATIACPCKVKNCIKHTKRSS